VYLSPHRIETGAFEALLMKVTGALEALLVKATFHRQITHNIEI
jgi:hypothetical protein